MTERDDYLPHRFRSDAQELHRIHELIEDVSATFPRFVVDRRWPYELEERKAVPTPTDSQSTSAMILFALAAIGGRIRRDSPLLPAGLPREPLRFGAGDWQLFEGAWQRLIEDVERESQHSWKGTYPEFELQRHLSWSSSFGWDDPFTLTWLCELERSESFTGGAPNPVHDALLNRAAERVLNGFLFLNGQEDGREGPFLTWLPSPGLSRKEIKRLSKETKARDGNVSLDHAFPLLRFIHLREALNLAGCFPKVSEDGVTRSMLARIYEQLSKAEIGDGNFDPSELVFALEGTLRLQPNALSRPTLERALTLIARSQAQSPYWRAVKPFVSRAQGAVLFPLSVETANSLLRCCVLAERHYPDQGWFSQSVGLFKQYVDWLHVRQRKGQCLAAAGRAPLVFRGWHSEHVHFHQGIHLWETSQVLLFLVFYAALLDRHIAALSLRAANLSRSEPWQRTQKKWHLEYWDDPVTGRQVGDSLAGLPKDSRFRILDAYARDHLIQPRPHPDKLSAHRSPNEQHFSVLLFGPPGTGKTGFAEELCRALRWPLITITPSDFIHGGESQVEARAKMIFEVLEAQADVVVLFDEIDRMILDRDSYFYERQSDIFQFMTPSMLTKIRDLWKRKRLIFLIATNYEERVDAAIKRRGRIDERCLVAPPDHQGRQAILEALLRRHLEKRRLAAPTDPVIGATLATVARNTRLMVYGELKQLFEDALRTPDDVVQIAQALELRAAQAYPAIRLLAYGPRFLKKRPGSGDEEEVGAKPFVEFLVLVYLRLEADGRLDTEERMLVAKVLDGLAKTSWNSQSAAERRAILAATIEDATLVEGLMQGLERELS